MAREGCFILGRTDLKGNRKTHEVELFGVCEYVALLLATYIP